MVFLFRKSSLLVFLLFIGLLGWWYFSQPKPTINVNPYEQYELSLQTPSPASEITALVHGLQRINEIPKWKVVSIEYVGTGGRAKLKSQGGTATQLLTMTQARGMVVNFSSSGTFLNFSSELNHRTLPDKILSTEETVATVINRMSSVLPEKSVEVNQTIKNQVFKQVDMTISFKMISPAVLQSIGSKLDDLPVNVNIISASIENELLSGFIKISVVGK